MARTRDETVRDLLLLNQTSPVASEQGMIQHDNGTLYAEDSVGRFNLRQGAAADTKEVKVSSDDTTEGFLEAKIAEGLAIDLETLNPAGNEQLQISVGFRRSFLLMGG